MPPPTPNNTPQPDYGVATYERVTHTMAKITGVPFTDSAVFAQYMTSQQSMPSTPLISAFVASQQTAIGQLAGVYCASWWATQSLRDAFFGTGLDASLNSSAASFFNVRRQSPDRRNALTNNAVGVNVSPAMAAAVTSEVDALLQRFYQPVSLAGGVEPQLPRPPSRRRLRRRARRCSAAPQSRCSDPDQEQLQ